MIFGILILFGLYSICMLILIVGFSRISLFPSEILLQATQFSVVIPFRNEAENLPTLIESITKLDYSLALYEIIFVNDFSEDNSAEIINEFIKSTNLSVRLLQNKHLSNSPKKDAISEAIKNSDYEWIVLTDADCELPKNWLHSFDRFIQSEENQRKSIVMICGPVVYKTDEGMIQNFQHFEGLSLQVATIGSFGLNNPILCNGANLAYKKNAFVRVNGFDGNNHIASGDDVFLLEKMQNTFPGQVKFLKSREAIVETKPQYSWDSVINQRIRWASKTSKQKNPFAAFMGILVFLVNLVFLILPLFFLFQVENWVLFLVLFGLKIAVDFIVIIRARSFFKTENSLSYFGFLPLIYAALTVWIVLKSFGGNYSWKSREY